MRVRLLVIWITLTALLQWSRAQEDNIQEVTLADEEKPPEIKEDMNTSPTTAIPGGEPFTDAVLVPQIKNEDHHQSGEDKKEEPVGFGMGTMDIPSDGSMISVMSAEETTALPPPTEKPTNPEPSSSEPDILKKRPISPVRLPPVSALPDYQDDTPFENNSLPAETTPPAPTPAPVHRPQSCYSCLNCNATITDDQKATCKTVPGDRNGCYTMLVKDKNLIPDQKNYLERGCVSELTEVFFNYCNHNKELCKKCDSNYCNVHDMTSLQVTTAGATSARLFEFLLIGSICWVSWWRRQVFY